MYKKIGIASIFAGVLLTASVANATIIDTVDVDTFLGVGDFTEYTHNLLDNDDFIAGAVTSGTLEVLFSDDAYDTDGLYADWEVILIVVEEFDGDTGGLSISTSASSFSNELEIKALAEVNKGSLDITIASIWGDFTIGQSILTLETTGGGFTSDVNSVPEPGILGLLALGLLGIGVTRRKSKT